MPHIQGHGYLQPLCPPLQGLHLELSFPLRGCESLLQPNLPLQMHHSLSLPYLHFHLCGFFPPPDGPLDLVVDDEGVLPTPHLKNHMDHPTYGKTSYIPSCI
jgi:hypothetical protein